MKLPINTLLNCLWLVIDMSKAFVAFVLKMKLVSKLKCSKLHISDQFSCMFSSD